ncbi:hypothetical protein DXG03_007441 [Asterophora parasitica]|uniref:Uncharacterized protein n=1 Tax=Asterophora parasitica TaxID=117018 RepID=A0A9P7G6S7_9AGAR|nr:hypothetical protein DXG03_007441 [Asterophora parasitica]
MPEVGHKVFHENFTIAIWGYPRAVIACWISEGQDVKGKIEDLAQFGEARLVAGSRGCNTAELRYDEGNVGEGLKNRLTRVYDCAKDAVSYHDRAEQEGLEQQPSGFR